MSKVNVWQRSMKWAEARNDKNSTMFSVLVKPRALARAFYLKAKKHISPIMKGPQVLDYAEAMFHFLDNVTPEAHAYPCVIPNWDNSPRAGRRATVLRGSTPELFRQHLRQALRLVLDRDFEDRIIFVKSWNEWAEGNYLEPDLRFGLQYLKAIHEEVLASGRDTIA
jgi:hypothetical protein